MRNGTITNLDADQITKMKFDEIHDAERVILVGGEKLELSIDSDKIAQAVKDGLSGIEFKNQTPTEKQIEIQTIEKNVFIPQLEIKTIEVPVIIKEIEYREIEKPIIIEKIVTIEKPVIIVQKEIEIKEIYKERYYPIVIKVSAVIQGICVLGLLILNLLRK